MGRAAAPCVGPCRRRSSSSSKAPGRRVRGAAGAGRPRVEPGPLRAGEAHALGCPPRRGGLHRAVPGSPGAWSRHQTGPRAGRARRGAVWSRPVRPTARRTAARPRPANPSPRQRPPAPAPQFSRGAVVLPPRGRPSTTRAAADRKSDAPHGASAAPFGSAAVPALTCSVAVAAAAVACSQIRPAPPRRAGASPPPRGRPVCRHPLPARRSRRSPAPTAPLVHGRRCRRRHSLGARRGPSGAAASAASDPRRASRRRSRSASRPGRSAPAEQPSTRSPAQGCVR